MARVRVFEAAAEGFRLIGREPKAVLVWSAALFVLMGLPAIFMVQQLAPVFASMSVAMDDESGEAMMLAMGRMFAIMPLAYLIMIVGYTVVGGAVLRAVIAPSDRRYFYLRVSSAEGWMALSAVVGIILAYIASALLLFIGSLVIILPIAFLAAAAGGVGDAFSGVHWVLVLGIFAFEIAMAYLWLRFSMAPIISFDERRFRLFESWAFTRGAGWSIFWLVLLLTVVIVVVECVVIAVAFAGVGAAMLQSMQDPAASGEMMLQLAKLYASPSIWGVMAVGYLLSGPAMALCIAPFARVYLMLKPAPAEEPGLVATV
ncbi:MAG: hypothetical protein J0I28_00730 [Caulobacterales bacterium]|nr:hypothetical protein [Caulobacterales bacterium]